MATGFQDWLAIDRDEQQSAEEHLDLVGDGAFAQQRAFR
jgi:hypothetical protein